MCFRKFGRLKSPGHIVFVKKKKKQKKKKKTTFNQERKTDTVRFLSSGETP